MLGRVLSSKDQFLPTFSGWCVAIQTGQLADIEIEKTSLTYLPSVNHPITDFATIYKVFEIIQNRAKNRRQICHTLMQHWMLEQP